MNNSVQSSKWEQSITEVPQGMNSNPLFFNVFINKDFFFH